MDLLKEHLKEEINQKYIYKDTEIFKDENEGEDKDES
jgi:hypothetical protein